MDYDQSEIATCYDKARELAPETARLWLDLLSIQINQTAGSIVVDLGCGTGRFSDLIATTFRVEVIGIDPSTKMIGRARAKPMRGTVAFYRAPAEAIPVANHGADLIFMSQVYHHLRDPAAVASECHRILRPRGRICIRTSTKENDFPQRQFFPLESLIASELPSQTGIERVFSGSGFTCIVHDVVRQVFAPDWGGFVAKSALRGDSFLARLADADFESGMAAMRSPSRAIDPNAPVTEEIDWFVFGRPQ